MASPTFKTPINWLTIGTVASLLLGIISAIPTVLAWFDSSKPILSIRVDNFQILDRQRSVGLNVYSKAPIAELPFRVETLDGVEIKRPIYEAQISVWNRGSAALGGDKLRQPLRLELPSAFRLGIPEILHAEAKDGLDVQIASIEPDALLLKWSYMDPGRGFRLRVVYTADRPVDIKRDVYIDGIVENANDPVFDRYPLQSLVLFGSLILLTSILLLLASRMNSLIGNIGVGLSCVLPLVVILLIIKTALSIATPPF